MKYTDANRFYDQTGKQFGDKLIYITSNGIEEQLQGYKILSFDKFDPDNIEYVNTVPATADNWNDAYDQLFGHPLENK